MRQAVLIAALGVVGCGAPARGPAGAAPESRARAGDDEARAPVTRPCEAEREVVRELLGTRRFRPASLSKVALSADGQVLMTVGSSQAELWDPQTGERLRELPSWLGRASLAADGRRLATFDASLMGPSVKVVDTQSGQVVRRWPQEGYSLVQLALGPQGNVLAVAAKSGDVELRDVSGEGPARRLRGMEGEISALAFSPTSAELLAGSGSKGQLRLWQTARGEGKRLEAGDETVTSLAFSPKGRRLVAGGADGMVRIYDPSHQAPTPLATFEAWIPNEPREIRGVAVTDDGRRVMVGTWSGVVALFDPQRSEPLAVLAEGHLVASAVTFAPDGKTAVGGAPGGALRFWDAETGAERSRGPVGNVADPDGAFWSADGHRLVIAGGGAWADVWDMRCGEVTGRLTGHRRRVERIDATRDGGLLVTGDNAGWVRLWDGRSLRPTHAKQDHFGDVEAVALSEDGKLVGSGGRQGSVVVRDTDRFGVVFERKADDGADTLFALGLSSKHGLVVTGDVMGRVEWLDLATGAPLAIRRDDYPNNIRSLRLSPDGTYLASAASDRIRIFDVATAALVTTFSVPGWTVTPPAWLADSRRLVFGDSDGHLWLVDAPDGRVLKSAAHEGLDISAVAVHPQHETVLSAHDDTTLRLWDPDEWKAPSADGASGEVSSLKIERVSASERAEASPLPPSTADRCARAGASLPVCALDRLGSMRFRLEDDVSQAGALVVSPDGSRLAAGGGEHLVIYDLASGDVLQRLPCCTAAPVAAAFSPDGHWLAVTPWAGSTQIWDLRDGRQKAAWSYGAHHFAVSADGKTWIASDGREKVYVNDHRGRGRRLLLEAGSNGVIEADVRGLTLSTDGKRLAVLQAANVVTIWDVASATERWAIESDAALPGALLDEVVVDVAFEAEGAIHISTTESLYLRRRDGTWTARARPVDGAQGETMACTAGGRRCVAPVEGGLGVADVGKTTRVLTTGDVDGFALGPKGKRLLVARGHDLGSWDLDEGRRINPPPTDMPTGPLSTSSDGLVLTMHDQALKLWRLPDDEPQRAARLTARNARLSRNGKVVVAATDNGLLALDPKTGKTRVLAEGRFEGALSIDAAGNRVAAVQQGEDGTQTLRIVETSSGSPVWSQAMLDGLAQLALSPDGGRIAWAVAEQLEVRTAKGKPLAAVDVEHGVEHMVFSPKGEDVIVAGDGHIERYAARGGAHRGYVGDHANVQSFAITDDGRLLVSGGLDHMVRVFDLERQRLLAVLPGHGRWVHSVAVSSDPPVAISLDRDGVVLRWDLKPWDEGSR